MVFPTFFQFKSEFGNKELQSAPGLIFADCLELSIFGCKEYNQSDFSIDHLVMSMCRVFLENKIKRSSALTNDDYSDIVS